MNGVICSEYFNESILKEELNEYPSMKGMDLAKIVSTKNEYIFSKKGAKKVVVIDFGVKKNILNIFQKFMVIPFSKLEGFWIKIMNGVRI